MRNWTIKEAVEVIKSGTDAEAIKEIARINPLFVVAVAKDDVATLASMMGEKFTVRRLEINGAVANEDAEDEVMNAPEAEATEEAGDEDLNSMSTKQLMALCDKRGIKVPHYGKNKQFYLDALQNAGDATEAEEEAEAEEVEEATDAYEGKSAMELFKECKKRGIKVEAKKNAKYYIAALKKADEVEAEEEAEDEADGWDDGDDDSEEEAPKPTKATKGGKAKATAKAEKAPAKSASKSKATKAEAEDDDDEDWDI